MMQPPPRLRLSAGDELAAIHARLAGILLNEQTVQTALQLITSLARDTLPGSIGSGVTLLLTDGRPASSASTDTLVQNLDRLQYGLEEGPCLTAWATSEVVRSDDLTADERWPIWTPQAVNLGARSVLSAPMEAGGTSWGAIKVYSATTGTYDESADDLLRRFADQAAIFVANVHTAQSTKSMGEDLKETLMGREVISTATGIVMAHKGLDYDSAFRQLVSLSRSARLSLRELAERMVATSTRTPHD
jgi:GAF domain-containing protein